MEYLINGDCLACGDCMVVCPREAIEHGFGVFYGANGLLDEVSGKTTPPYWNTRFLITGDCNGCGACAQVCGSGAIVPAGAKRGHEGFLSTAAN